MGINAKNAKIVSLIQAAIGKKKPSINPNIQQAAQNKLIGAINTSGQAAANDLLAGGQGVGGTISSLQQAIPGAHQAFAAQAGQALAAGAAQAGRGGASAYGGALQGGLDAINKSVGFDISAQQALAGMYKSQAGMSSEGHAIQSATAGKMLELGTANERTQKLMFAAQSQIKDIIDRNTHSYGDNTTQMAKDFDVLIGLYPNDPEMQAYLIRQKNTQVSFYTGIDG